MSKNSTAEKIIDCALLLLRERGDQGLSMRQLAQQAGISLSNVQYHFKNKDELLTRLADRYFNQCLDDIREQTAPLTRDSLHSQLPELLKVFLANGMQLTETCRIFREYWAMASRNPVIDDYLDRYYRQLSRLLSQQLEPVAASPQALSRSVSLLIPFFEGYSITARSLPETTDSMAEQLSDILIRLLHLK